VHAEVQQLYHRGTECPTVRQWRAWYAGCRYLLSQHTAREDRAGTFAWRWARAGESLGYAWMCRVSNPPPTSRSGRTDPACYGANAAKGHAATRAIGGWSGSCRSVIPMVSEGVRRSRCGLTRGHVCAKARDLICARSCSPTPRPCPRPRDQTR
jgi:hypothetical protein